MDATNPSAIPTFASRTPLHIGAVALKVRDLDRLTAYYRDALGLAVLDRTAVRRDARRRRRAAPRTWSMRRTPSPTTPAPPASTTPRS